MNSSAHERGFTLVELLVVISIIAVLSAIGLTIYSGTQKNARDARRRSDLLAIRTALEEYRAINNSYPSTGGLSTPFTEANCTSATLGTPKGYTGPGAYIPSLAPTYISTLPGDPNVNGATGRCYYYSSDGTDYIIAAHLGAENTYPANDQMIRYVSPDCAGTASPNPQQTFTILSTGGTCW